jgi:hypothetical protein
MDQWSTFELVDFLVTRGQHDLEEKATKVNDKNSRINGQILKSKCRQSASEMERVYVFIMNKYLKRKHSQVLFKNS